MHDGADQLAKDFNPIARSSTSRSHSAQLRDQNNQYESDRSIDHGVKLLQREQLPLVGLWPLVWTLVVNKNARLPHFALGNDVGEIPTKEDLDSVKTPFR